MGLRRFIMKRLVYSFVLLLIVIFLNFAIFKAMPGDPVLFLMQPWSRESPEMRRQQEQLLRDLWGFGDSAKNGKRYTIDAQVNLLDNFVEEMKTVGEVREGEA